ncbi:hypothetical protein D3C76_1654030 [compost metagenome]
MIQVFGAGLFDRIVDGVAAAFIYTNGMGHSDPILKGCTLLFAWSAAVGVVGAFTEEGAVHAVLGMEHRQMLMDDDFHL